MSILQSLKILNRPIAELAMLPQEQIIQLAQMGHIPIGFVAPIIGAKAERTKAGAAAAAMMTQQQMPQPTVLEKIMAENAVGEVQSQLPEDVGIGALPVDERSLPDEFAGGGIVAFQSGGLSKAEIERRLREAQAGRGPDVSRPGAINPRPQGVPEDLLPKTPYFIDPDSFIDTEADETDVSGRQPSANLAGIDINALMSRAEGIASNLRPATQTKVPTIQEASKQTSDILAASGYDSQMLDKIRQDIEKQRESLKGDRSEAMNLRLLEAGLAIMGGTSPYAFENIGKGASGAVKGLAQDIKDLKKSERDLRSAEQNLMLKQNDAAMGKARITQSTIDKAQERLDRETENYNRTKADFTKTLLSGEIQEKIARASYSNKMTDFDKQWALYSKDAKARGEPATLDGFRRALEGSRSAVTDKDATRMAVEALKNSGLDLTTPEGRAQFEELKRYFMQQGGGGVRASASGKAPPLPSGFVLQP